MTVRRPTSDDALAQLIEQALWDAKGDEGTASVLAAEAIRDAGYVLLVAGPIEAAFRAAIDEPEDVMKFALREVVLRQARGLDDPGNARNSKQLWEVARQALGDMNAGGAADDTAEVMAAIRGAIGSGDDPSVGDPA